MRALLGRVRRGVEGSCFVEQLGFLSCDQLLNGMGSGSHGRPSSSTIKGKIMRTYCNR